MKKMNRKKNRVSSCTQTRNNSQVNKTVNITETRETEEEEDDHIKDVVEDDLIINRGTHPTLCATVATNWVIMPPIVQTVSSNSKKPKKPTTVKHKKQMN